MSSLHLLKTVLSDFIRCEMLFTPPVASRGGESVPTPRSHPVLVSRDSCDTGYMYSTLSQDVIDTVFLMTLDGNC